MMIFYDYYADIPSETVDGFVDSMEMGRLVTVSPEGLPHIGLYPFVYLSAAIELHVNRRDEQYVDLKARSRCLFEVDDVLGVIPSYWIHPENAVMATAYHRTVVFECDAVVSEDPALLGEQQTRLLARYQPQGGFRAVGGSESLYRGAIASIVAIRLTVRERRVKWKLGQNRPAEVRAKVAEELRKRGRPNDARAAAALQWTIDREAGG
jgi:uncharacterized protein